MYGIYLLDASLDVALAPLTVVEACSGPSQLWIALVGLVGVFLGGAIAGVTSWFVVGKEAQFRRQEAKRDRLARKQDEQVAGARRVTGMLVGALEREENSLLSGLTNETGETFASNVAKDFKATLKMEAILLPRNLADAATNAARKLKEFMKVIVDLKREYYQPLLDEGFDLTRDRNSFILALAKRVGNDARYIAAGLAAHEGVSSYISDARMFVVMVRAADKG